ncbi:hypothetical protein LCGC14_0700230 [marine sediment metagenome]|uniref:PDGLE domain-containing protein n=1 Tax=marine sediment metagenome TaxID=412755 RepID=A0A0F9T415_9ZZZZ
MSLMKKVLLILFIVLLLSFAYSTKGNTDILKKNIIDKCEGIDEFGNCITNKEIEPVNEQITETIVSIGQATAVNLGVPDSIDLLTIVLIISMIVVLVILVMMRLSQ